MPNFYISALLLLAAVCQPTSADGYQEPFGCNPALPYTDVTREQIMYQTYGGREDLVKGYLWDAQQKVPPKPENMYLPIWDCSMEEEAQKLADQCPTSTPTAPNNYAVNYGRMPPDRLAEFSVSEWREQVEKVVFENPYNGDPGYREFANMVQTSISRYACASKACPVNETVNICIYNAPNIQAGQMIYTPGTPCAADSDCTKFQPATCNDEMCLLVIPTTTAAPPAPTTPPANANPKPELNQWCPANCCMLDRVRVKALDMHNYRRSQLAKGLVAKNTGKLLPQAANMLQLRYDCELEKAAQAHADKCVAADSDPNTRPGIEENVNSLAITPSIPYKIDAMSESVKTWWKQVRLVEGIGMKVTFKAHHLQSTIRWFTKMAWATTEWLGCAVAKCDAQGIFVVVCRYKPGGNIVDHVVYEVGEQCNCPTGYSCSTGEKLCILNP
uniref:Venom allergen/ancylostoma secreted protein-like 9 n=1 Tax=Heligmosomoides polygyrus bakeri TaxID=375939 RepID=G4XWX8_HELBE|nr:venom allergen/ancylostoma secreted protein-like 9 [Heligmosomoides bakeri]